MARVVRAGLPALVLAAGLAGPCAAQTYPAKPVRLVAPFPAGGVLDVFARITAQKLGERMGQQVVVDNQIGRAHV